MDHDWRLSPAYDLTPTMPVSPEQRDLAMVSGNAGRIAKAKNLLSQCARFLLKGTEAKAIICEMEERVRQTWYTVA